MVTLFARDARQSGKASVCSLGMVKYLEDLPCCQGDIFEFGRCYKSVKKRSRALSFPLVPVLLKVYAFTMGLFWMVYFMFMKLNTHLRLTDVPGMIAFFSPKKYFKPSLTSYSIQAVANPQRKQKISLTDWPRSVAQLRRTAQCRNTHTCQRSAFPFTLSVV